MSHPTTHFSNRTFFADCHKRFRIDVPYSQISRSPNWDKIRRAHKPLICGIHKFHHIVLATAMGKYSHTRIAWEIPRVSVDVHMGD